MSAVSLKEGHWSGPLRWILVSINFKLSRLMQRLEEYTHICIVFHTHMLWNKIAADDLILLCLLSGTRNSAANLLIYIKHVQTMLMFMF